MTKQLLYFLFLVTGIAVMAIGSTKRAYAQDTGGMEEIEKLFHSEEESPEATAAPGANSSSTSTQAPASGAAGAAPSMGSTPSDSSGPAVTPPVTQSGRSDVKNVTDLSKLQPFKDVAVIQKRFLPKSKRFEFYIAPALMLNDAFFFDFGANARLGYYFQERYGIELVYTYLASTARGVTNDLALLDIQTTSFVTPQGYYGVDFKWIPMYGKMTWRNQKITPFDFYFSFGLGVTPTNQSTTPATLHLGTGQEFAHSKAGALRWDFSWFMYQSTSSVTGGGSAALYHNLLFSIGWSFFFPEATYR